MMSRCRNRNASLPVCWLAQPARVCSVTCMIPNPRSHKRCVSKVGGEREMVGESEEIQYYEHVRNFPIYLSATHSRCDDMEVRQLLLENLVGSSTRKM